MLTDESAAVLGAVDTLKLTVVAEDSKRFCAPEVGDVVGKEGVGTIVIVDTFMLAVGTSESATDDIADDHKRIMGSEALKFSAGFGGIA